MGGRTCIALLALLIAWPFAAPAGRAWALAPVIAPVAGVDFTQTTRLHLYSLKGETLLFEGLRTIVVQGGRVNVTTVYTRPGGDLVQRTEAVFDVASLAPVSYLLEDARTGERALLRREGDRVVMSYRTIATDAPGTDSVAFAPELRFAATVEPMLRREWSRLVTGGSVTFRLLVPSRLDVYAFHLQREYAAALQRPGMVVVRMEPDTWLVRQMVAPLYFVLDEAPPHLLREFRGRSSIKTDGGADQDLRIELTDAG
jgi:hypothetical protein